MKVTIYEDNDLLRESLTYLIKGADSLEFSGAYPDCRNILEECETNQPNVILMDIDMPYISGIDATRLVKDKFPAIEIMMLTVFEDRDKIFDALRAGASGYLLKKTSSVKIIESIIELSNGGSPISSEIARKVLEFFSTKNRNFDNEYTLSERELDVLKCLVAGDSYKMTAEHCNISIGTVCCHIHSIYRKLAVNSKSEAVIKAIKERLV
ncbi:MAG: response regulator transcription factor [Porphyromonadaceae bacterium]|nr:response regulator transcription factor [Porphyromonadaceae bacterium]